MSSPSIRKPPAAVVVRSSPQGITVTNDAGHVIKIAVSPSTEGFNPLQLQAAALAVCTSLGIRRQAGIAGLGEELREFQIRAEGFKSHEAPSRLERFELRVTLDGNVDEDVSRTLVEEAEKACTIANTLRLPAVVQAVVEDTSPATT